MSAKKIPRFHPDIGIAKLAAAAAGVLSGRDAGGENVRRLESTFANLIDTKAACALSSVRFGLYHSLKYFSISPGDEILTTPLTVYPVIDILIAAGARPVFVDFDGDSFSPDLASAKSKLTDRSRFFLLTHLWGVPADAPAAKSFCDDAGLILLEDCSQCLNGSIDEKKIGSFGAVSFFSLSFTKTVDALGGALAASDDLELTESLRRACAELPPTPSKKIIAGAAANLIGSAGTDPLIFNLITGCGVSLLGATGARDYLDNSALAPPDFDQFSLDSINYRFCDLQARIAESQLADLPERDEQRRKIAEIYFDRLAEVNDLRLPPLLKNALGNFWMFVIRTPNRSTLKKHLWSNYRIDSAIPSIDNAAAMVRYAFFSARVPNAERSLAEALYIPAFAGLSPEDARRIADSIAQLVGQS